MRREVKWEVGAEGQGKAMKMCSKCLLKES